MLVDGRVWILPHSLALWIPANMPHSIESTSESTLTTLWFDPACCPLTWDRVTPVHADALLAALATRLDDAELPRDARARTEAVLFDVIQPSTRDVVSLPDPIDERARRVTDALRASPADERTLAEWGREVGASARTLARALNNETGLGFHEWRTRVRILASLPRLAAGEPLAVVAGAVGYSTSSAFGAAFRRTIGVTPAKYFGGID